MIILYVFLGIIGFLFLLFVSMLFIPFKIIIKGAYWDKEPAGQLDAFWIKYILGARSRITDKEYIRIRFWFLGIPIPLKFKIKEERKKSTEEISQKPESDQEDEPVRVDKKEEDRPEKAGLKDKIKNLIQTKDAARSLWHKYKAYVQKIYVTYITYSFEYINTELGLKDPAETGMIAGIVYSALALKPSDKITVNYDYAKPKFNISAQIKMTMNLYGILCTLLSLYLRFKKDKRNEAQ